MKILVTYKSKTGFTQKYANWISESINSDIKDIDKVSAEDISKYNLIIHGGWIMGSVISGLNIVKKLNPKKLMVYAVGYTPKDKVDMKQLIDTNKLDNIPFYYFDGGMNPKKMGFVGRTIVKLVTKQTPTYKDNTNKDEIKDLVNDVLKNNKAS